MLRVLVALSIVQTIAIGFLAARVIELDSRILHTEEAVAARYAPAADNRLSIPADAVIAEATPAFADAKILRQVIREELAALSLQGAQTGSATTVAATTPSAAADPRQMDKARRSFNGLVGKHDVGPADLDRYLDTIALLPEKERKEALRELTKAMNDGRINGQF